MNERSPHAEALMRAEIAFVADTATLEQAATRMRERNTDVLVVMRGEAILGTISARDLALEGCTRTRDPRSTQVLHVMSAGITECRPDATLESIVPLMRVAAGQTVLVRGESGAPIGLVTCSSLLEALEPPAGGEPRGPVPEHVRRVRGEPL